LLIFGLVSCGQAVSTADSKTIDDTAGTALEPSISNTSSSVNGDKYSRSIYELYIDPQLKTYLDKAFKGWTLPAPNRWDTVWFNQYKSDSTLVNYLSTDFDCNKKRDYALLFKNASGVIVAYAFLSTGDTFNAVELMDFGKDTGEQIEVGLELLPPGDYNHIDPENEENPPPVKIKCSGIQVLNFERAAKTFYWEKGKLKSIITGD
ncbi:MAG: hypothetical protein J7502_02135, partial [Flavisolibacter sp.]|nr:hypothetical protein [Flavisolibacter sp.]